MRRRLAAIVKRAWRGGAEWSSETRLFHIVLAFGLCGLLVGAVGGAIFGAAGVSLSDDVGPSGLGQTLLELRWGVILSGGGALWGALLGGVLGAFSGVLIGGVEAGLGVTEAVITSLRARRTTGVVTEVAPARAPAGRGDEAASAPMPTLEFGGEP
jgi:hypothetical protein